MRGDRTREGVVLVLQASPDCRQRNPSRMLVAFRGIRSVRVLMNAAVDQTGCAFRSDMGRFPHSPSGPCLRTPLVHLPNSKDEAKENLCPSSHFRRIGRSYSAPEVPQGTSGTKAFARESIWIT